MAPHPGFRLIALLLVGCAVLPAAPPAETVPLPQQSGLGDPIRGTVLAASAGFNEPSHLAGRPAEVAREAARLEWLAANLTTAPGWNAISPQVGLALDQARVELRAAFGLRPMASPAAVAGAMLAAARALDGGDREAASRVLAPVAVEDGDAVLARLSALPPLPRTEFATSMARRELSLDGLYDVD